MPILVVERGNDKGATLKVEPQKSYVVGRDNPQAALRLTDPMASRGHFQIAASDGGWRIRDLKSRNGTLLNDEKLAPEADADLKIGDKIQVGETIFSFLSDEKEESAAGLIGKTIGGYRLIERVGRGGMGTVYRAEQMSLNRVVALKVLSSKLLSDPVFVQRFVAEAKAAGGLTHPNIVQVIDVGSDRGVYYFSMEFMDHGSVGDIVAKDGPVPWQRALEMLTDAARGLIFAEKKGIIHRDIKPDNLMLTSEGAVKIGDLGLAKKAEDVAGEGGQIFGTPHFIAPEQAQGKPIDHRADIYALGATFYRVLSGRTPFSGENVKEILIKQVQEEPKPLKDLVPDLPDEIAAVVGKMMKKRPDDRYRSAQGLFEDLERIRVRYHLEAHGQAASARRTKVIAFVLALLVLGLGAMVYYFLTKPPPEPTVIERPGTGTQNGNGGQPTPPPVDPEKVAADAFLLVYGDEVRLMNDLKGGPAETWKTGEAKWLRLADAWQKVAAENPGTRKGEEADGKAKGIRRAIADAKEADRLRRERAVADWAALLAEADRLRAEGRFAAAAAWLAEKSVEPLKSRGEYLGPEAAEGVRKRYEDLVAEATAKVEPLLKAAGEAAPVFPGERYLAARKALQAVRPGLVPAQGAKDPSAERLRALSDRIRDTLRSTRDAARAAAGAALDADRAAYFRTYLQIRRWNPSAEPGEADPAPESPFFAFRWDQALEKWEGLLKELRTEPFQVRARRKIDHYRRCRRLFATLGARVRAKEIANPGFPDSVEKGSSVILDSTKRDEATAEGVWTLRISTRTATWVEFREMTPRELYEDFLKKGEGVPFTGEDHLDLAVFLAEAGCGDAAWGELTAASAGANPAAVDAALSQWIQDESTIFTEYHGQGGVFSSMEGYRRARESGMRPADLEPIRKAVEQRVREFLAAERLYKTDYFILHFSVGGPDGPVPDRLFPAGVTDAVVETLGVPGGSLAGEDDGETERGK